MPVQDAETGDDAILSDPRRFWRGAVATRQDPVRDDRAWRKKSANLPRTATDLARHMPTRAGENRLGASREIACGRARHCSWPLSEPGLRWIEQSRCRFRSVDRPAFRPVGRNERQRLLHESVTSSSKLEPGASSHIAPKSVRSGAGMHHPDSKKHHIDRDKTGRVLPRFLMRFRIARRTLSKRTRSQAVGWAFSAIHRDFEEFGMHLAHFTQLRNHLCGSFEVSKASTSASLVRGQGGHVPNVLTQTWSSLQRIGMATCHAWLRSP